MGVSHGDRENPVTCHRSHHVAASGLWGRGPYVPEQGTPEALGCQPQCSQLLILGSIWVAMGTWIHLAPGRATEDAVIQALRVQVLHRQCQL